jgi:hypothetical protein
MPLNEIPKHFHPDVRLVIEAALEDAWRESKTDDSIKPRVKGKLRTTIVALAAVGETDCEKLKRFAIHAWRDAIKADQAA